MARLAGVSDPGIAVAEDEHGIKIKIGDRVGADRAPGATLDALQLLTGLVVNHQNGRSDGEYRRVTLDMKLPQGARKRGAAGRADGAKNAPDRAPCRRAHEQL